MIWAYCTLNVSFRKSAKSFLQLDGDEVKSDIGGADPLAFFQLGSIIVHGLRFCPSCPVFLFRCVVAVQRPQPDVAHGAKDGATPTFAAPSSPSEAVVAFEHPASIGLDSIHDMLHNHHYRDAGRGCVSWCHSLHKHLKFTMQVKWLWSARWLYFLTSPTQSQITNMSWVNEALFKS